MQVRLHSDQALCKHVAVVNIVVRSKQTCKIVSSIGFALLLSSPNSILITIS